MTNRYNTIPALPEETSAANVISRMLSGIGFRFYWATDGLTDEVYSYQPGKGVWSIEQIVEHIWVLLNWIYKSFDPAGLEKPSGAKAWRDGSLERVELLEKSFSNMSDEELISLQILKQPFWLMINGPLADALTHVGQISSIRRMAGSPAPKSNSFRGTPPIEKH